MTKVACKKPSQRHVDASSQNLPWITRKMISHCFTSIRLYSHWELPKELSRGQSILYWHPRRGQFVTPLAAACMADRYRPATPTPPCQPQWALSKKTYTPLFRHLNQTRTRSSRRFSYSPRSQYQCRWMLQKECHYIGFWRRRHKGIAEARCITNGKGMSVIENILPTRRRVGGSQQAAEQWWILKDAKRSLAIDICHRRWRWRSNRWAYLIEQTNWSRVYVLVYVDQKSRTGGFERHHTAVNGIVRLVRLITPKKPCAWHLPLVLSSHNSLIEQSFYIVPSFTLRFGTLQSTNRIQIWEIRFEWNQG